MNKKSIIAIATVFIVLLIDQVSKIWVKTSMYLGEEIVVFQRWFIIHFTENPGMAFGWKWGGEWGKYALTSFRVVAICAIGYYIYRLIKEKQHTGFIATMSLILAGAIGNVLDCFFYGLSFTDSYQRIAEVFPAQGYAGFMQGKVVDMLYFPLWHWPEFVPFVGGDLFFPFIFNIADSAITIGVILLLIFQKVFFKEENKLVESK